MNKKHIIFLMPFASLLLTTGCKDYSEDFPVPPGSLVAKFSFVSATGFTLPDTIAFANESVIPENIRSQVTYLWDFGDGQTSTEENPTHIFTSEDTFLVTLTPVAQLDNRIMAYSEQIIIQKIVKSDTLFYENFDDLQLFPPEWALINLDGNTPDNPSIASLKDSAFIVVSSEFFEGNMAMGVSFYSPEAGADDWMILPKIQLGDSSILKWQAMSLTTTGNYPDDYQIRISTTTQDVEGCLDNPVLYRVNDEEWRESATAKPGKGIQNRQISLKKYAGKEVYIAFRLNTPEPGGDRLGIDEITVLQP
jgi:hypothetical protein